MGTMVILGSMLTNAAQSELLPAPAGPSTPTIVDPRLVDERCHSLMSELSDMILLTGLRGSMA
jgi:hypothetical protein